MLINGVTIRDGVTLTSGLGNFVITGGTVSYSGDYTIRTFTSNSNLVISSTNSGLSLPVEYLLIGAGGGSAQPGLVGGGGAGGLISGNINLSIGTYPVIVGQGRAALNGTDSTFNNLTALGGGAGGIDSVGSPGGSGGGGAARPGPSPLFPGGGYQGGTGLQAVLGYGLGTSGGHGRANVFNGGGGGGAGNEGASGLTPEGRGRGGNGIQSNITGSLTYYAGGGRNGFPGSAMGLGSNTYGGGAGGATAVGNIAGQPGVLIIKYLTAGTA